MASYSPPSSDGPSLATASSILVLPLHVTEEPTSLAAAGGGSGHSVQLDLSSLSGADDSLADLQPEPEEEGERRGGWEGLIEEQKKLEFMASLGLVPPAVLEEVHRRQNTCKSEYGNWWDRLHSTDFCLVPKTDSSLHSLHILNCDGEEEGVGEGVMSDCAVIGGEGRGGGGEVMTQVTPRPDAGALVEQITYLTSWPQTTPPDTANSVEVITQPAVHPNMERHEMAADDIMPQSLRDHYASILADQDQMSEHAQLQNALQHITTYR